jgi:hypothetical protein
MDQAKAEQLMDVMEADPELFAEFQRDPEGTAERAGLTLNDEERETLRVASTLSGSEMRERISKVW